jgi:outer membrane protein assembly factor BamB
MCGSHDTTVRPAAGTRRARLPAAPTDRRCSSPGEGASATGHDYATVAYEATTGALVWVARYRGQHSTCCDNASSVGASPDGSRVFVTGRSGAPGSQQIYATVAYDAATGAELWVARYNGPGLIDQARHSLQVRMARVSS